MYGTGVPSPVWALLGAVAGAAIKGAVDLLMSHDTAETDKRKTSGSVESSDAKVVFDAQQAAFVMSEQMRHDLRDQVERCQVETQKVKDDYAALDDRMRAQSIENAAAQDKLLARLESMEAELEKLHKQLEEQP